METFKLDLSTLTPVAEADRVKGSWYVVADELKQYDSIRQWYSGNISIDWYGGGKDLAWEYWFEIPESFIREHYGFVMPEKGDNIEYSPDKGNTWRAGIYGNSYLFRPIQTTPPLPAETLPEESREDRKSRLQKYLEELEA